MGIVASLYVSRHNSFHFFIKSYLPSFQDFPPFRILKSDLIGKPLMFKVAEVKSLIYSHSFELGPNLTDKENGTIKESLKYYITTQTNLM